MELDIYWPTPIFKDHLSEISDEEMQNIIDHILATKESSTGRVYSNKGGWQSDDYYIDKETNPTIINLFDHIQKRLDMVREILELENRGSVQNNYWYNVNTKENFNMVHIHPGSILVGVFYVKTIPREGDVTFFRSNSLEDYYYASYRKRNGTNIIAGSQVNYHPSDRMLLIFPGWLPHIVQPTNSKETRISIAFNVGK